MELSDLKYSNASIYQLNAFPKNCPYGGKPQRENSISHIMYFKWFQKSKISHQTYKNSTERNTEISLNIQINTTIQLASLYKILPSPVTARSKAWICGRSIVGITSLNPAEGTDVRLVSFECCAYDGLCDEPITYAEESYRLYVSV